MKVIKVTKITSRPVSYDITTTSSNFFIRQGDSNVLIHNSPSIVFGRHPETGKFFVASKSAFNKTPKINYTPEDVDANHGHAPGLAQKLKTALEHLPKVTPKTGVFQGDIMHSGVRGSSNPNGDVVLNKGQAHFTPNTITYSTKKAGENKDVEKSKIGVAIHTSYYGDSFDAMKAQYNSGDKGFKKHPSVHSLDVFNPGNTISPEQSAKFSRHMASAKSTHERLQKNNGYDAVAGHTDHLKTYINETVRTGESPSVEGLQSHINAVMTKAIDKYKTPAKKQQTTQAMYDSRDHINTHAKHFSDLLALHGHLQSAKDQLVHAFSDGPNYDHNVDGKTVKPEGHVIVINNRPSKLVDRAEFSRLNFEKNSRQK